MANRFLSPQLPVLVFTDLDGTLLDHHDYSFAAAAPALARLAELNIPVIPTTSKTLAELEVLTKALDNPHPCIVENGSALCIPQGYFENLPGETEHGYHIVQLAPDYSTLLQILHRLRDEQDFCFRGFNDMTSAELAADTGLAEADAARAKQRQCSEPLVWQGTEEAFGYFKSALVEYDLSLSRGGRYWHVMGHQNKGKAMQQMQKLYEQAAGHAFTSIALGDCPNDVAMLNAADIAVIVRRPDGTHLDYDGAARVFRTKAIGPAGWNESMQAILDELQAEQRSVNYSHSCGS